VPIWYKISEEIQAVLLDMEEDSKLANQLLDNHDLLNIEYLIEKTNEKRISILLYIREVPPASIGEVPEPWRECFSE
jgi:hypothetical protein